MYLKTILIYMLIIIPKKGDAQDIVHINIGNNSMPGNSEVILTLKHRIQHYEKSLKSNGNTFDRSINSPKSVNILNKNNKFYIHSLEGYTTSVYSIEDFTKIKDIYHVFGKENQYLFNENVLF